MPTKRRLSKIAAYRITDDAVLAFLRGDCAELGRALGLKPWQVSPLDAIEPGPPIWAHGTIWGDGWPLAREIREGLLQAARAI